MATGGARRLYEEDDTVDDYLLNQVSKWVLYNRLPSLARNLGFSQAQFSRIVVPENQPEERVFKVMYRVFSFIIFFLANALTCHLKMSIL